ncbi:MAG: SAVED domain-containing protein [Weeksellaceae bacterium]
MSQSTISPKNKFFLWAISAGRCQYRGCAKSLYNDILTMRNFNQSYIAHIVADKPNGPRGDKQRSKLLSDDISNLMLLCDSHHRLIDREDVDGHPETLLKEMKQEHEDRVDNIFSTSMKSHIVTYKANIGKNTPNFDYVLLKSSLKFGYYPAENRPISLGDFNSMNKDSNPNFWDIEKKELDAKFDRFLLPLIKDNSIQHISLYAFAPIPLLIYLGTLINDIIPMDIMQKQRVPDTWEFADEESTTNYNFSKPNNIFEKIALKIELSDNISNERIERVMGESVSIYSLYIDKPNNDFIHSRGQIIDFTTKIKEVFRTIKKIHGEDYEINIFPAMPISLAVQLGRAWMPKADLPLKIYDQNRNLGGFIEAIKIN